MTHIARRRILAIFLILAAAAYLFFQTGYNRSWVSMPPDIAATGFQELGFPPIARIDYTGSGDFDRRSMHALAAGLTPELRIRYGFFVTIGLVGISCFAAGRLSKRQVERVISN